MAQTALLERIDAALKDAGLSERKALIRADVGLDFIRDMRRRGHSPNVDKLKRLASALKKPLTYFTDVVGSAVEPDAQILLETIPVVGQVQAGVWQEALGWMDPDDGFAVTMPVDRRFPKVRRFGLVVRGTSMDLLYPDGTIVLVVRFGDIDRSLAPKDRVVVLRRGKRNDEFEATIKQYDLDASGRHILWPRSGDPEFQTPYILTSRDHLLTGTNAAHLPSRVEAGSLQEFTTAHEAGAPDLQIVALVVGSYRPEIL